ncbi:hypothetical protein AB4865_02325 [Capnocytophaga sp. ARDL2]|uniref:hypothetical protein n=1 Tax=Capnocytophaga sp. ARDL2 TaxID=3238809 RepID=UPI003558DC12
MNQKIVLFFLCFFSLFSAIAQEKIVGKIVSKSRDLEGIIIHNTTTGVYTESEKRGYFNIEAKEGDVLNFSAVHMTGVQYVVKKEDLKKSLIFITMQRSVNILDEIYIDRTINSESLGFGKPNDYTATQRALMRATTSGGGIIPVDALVNYITGRSKMLNQAVEIEREYLKVENLINQFDQNYFTEYLKIQPEYVMAFGYYIINDSYLVSIAKRNTNFIEERDFLMSKKAVEFNQILQEYQESLKK